MKKYFLLGILLGLVSSCQSEIKSAPPLQTIPGLNHIRSGPDRIEVYSFQDGLYTCYIATQYSNGGASISCVIK